MLLTILLLAATISPCLSHVPKQAKQATRRDVVERMANAALHPPRPRRSTVPGDCTTLPTGTAYPAYETYGWLYHQFYSGSGFTEDPNNPGNDRPGFAPPITTDLGYLADISDAIDQCMEDAYAVAYDGFDLHFLTSTCTWICVQYVDGNMDNSYFDQPNTDVAIGYGYAAYYDGH